ncbi:biotin--[acetyl-CoA-carboxylase] ligase [Gaetbulibacter saemankumensis]|uniref:biotin--[acetyl-CoA-carboxylase] ligase n=1 Tax=Gaetbulibacter saemankumensis TaxID=311208 RepID=UPI00041E3DA0|nr:biotin--[acetyl-CoA-carboxylase] ligase [Gaetbulibacter saemankumensis]
MSIIKLNAIDSTNSYLRKLCAETRLEDFTAVITNNQTHGKGQMGAVWRAESSKNLTFSIYKDFASAEIEYPFYISIVTSLSIIKTLESLTIPKLNIKWPNDILAGNKKICGILIENVYKHGRITKSIIGIGLNVNQTDFENLPKASSLKLISGKSYDIDEIAQSIISNLKYYVGLLSGGKFLELKEAYESYLFRKNKPSTFKDAEGFMFAGIIQNVSESGCLQVLLEDELLKEFDLKSITLLY